MFLEVRIGFPETPYLRHPPIHITNPDNYKVAFEYDPNNFVTRVYNELGYSVTRTVDLTGRPRNTTDPNGNRIDYTHWDNTRDRRLQRITCPKTSPSVWDGCWNTTTTPTATSRAC